MEVELTFNNHFEFGYDDQPFTLRHTSDQRWFARYGRCKQRPLDFKSECYRAARLIFQKTQQDIWVLFSGGVDSEITLRSFVEQNLPVRVAILRFKDDLNLHDISYAVAACERLNISYTFFDLDLLKFWNTDALQYAKDTYCVTPMMLPTMWLVDQIPGYAILGSGECLLVKRKPDDYIPGVSPYEPSLWDLWEKEKIAGWFRHFMLRQKEGCPGFFQYTPELMLAFLSDSMVQQLVNNEIHGKLTTESSKLKIYQNYFELLDRPKFTGFEKVTKPCEELRAVLKKMLPFHDNIHKTEYHQLIRHLSPDDNVYSAKPHCEIPT